ncbi:uncharacterized protein LOC106661878 [Cimex lectularius]|uniref:Uncharacterized protein n=1 Tax=Cimex lectularius TaxID=79782 RepID=A0A8I6RBY3_CIMLE|nr:uncharacterized protein LOC106661878 [Cimex lectularius]
MDNIVFSCFRCWECLEVWCPCTCIKFGTTVLAVYTIFLAVLLLYLYVPEFAEFPKSFLHFFSLRRNNPFLGEASIQIMRENDVNVMEYKSPSSSLTSPSSSSKPLLINSKIRNLRKVFRYPQTITLTTLS